MALIKCRECNREISDQAASCPVCGCPIVATARHGSDAVPVVTEQTGKKWKNLQVAAALMVIGGCVVDVGSMGKGGPPDMTGMTIGSLLILVGILSFLYARIMAWYHHG